MSFSGPVGVDIDGGGEGLGVGVREIGTGEPGDLILEHGDIELFLVEHIRVDIIGCDQEMDGACGVVQEGIEVELFCSRGGTELEGLRTVDTAKACGGIEGTTAALILETHGGDILRIIVGDDKTTE